jgi:cobalt-zinc-cadmium efflux system membrane fusion protein
MIPFAYVRPSTLTFVAALIGFSFFGCQPKSAPNKPAFTATQSEVTIHESTAGITFKTAAVTAGDPIASPPVTARVVTVESLTEPMFSPLRGRVAEVRVRLGDHVKKGDHLFLIQTPELPELTRQRLEAKLAVTLKQSTVDRLEQLVAARAVPEHDLAIAQTELATAKVDVQSAEAKLHSLAVEPVNDGSYWIVANRNGTVVDLRVSPGASVGPDVDHPVCVIADLSQVLVIGDVPQSFANGIRPDLPANIRLPGQTRPPVRGVVQTVSGVVDPERQSVPVRVVVANPEGILRPNAFVELELIPESKANVLLVPTSAIVTDGLDTAVFVKRGENKFSKQQVTIGRQNAERTEIVAGIQAGEEVVVTNPLLLINALEDT